MPALEAQGAQYEPVFLRYPGADRRYTPDVVLPNAIAIELKGWFKPSDRSKMLAVKKFYPELELRMVLMSPDKPLNKKSTTTEAQWCEKHGIPWAAKEVPASWLLEPLFAESFATIHEARRHRVK